jgi:MFS family permease
MAKGFLGWLSLAQLISWGSTFYLFGLLVQPLEAELHITRAQSSLAFTLMLFAEGALAYAVGRWIDRGHARAVMSTGSVAVALCLLAHTQVTGLWGFYAVWTALGMALSAVLYQPAFAVVTRRFPSDFRRAIITLTFLGGLASTVFIPLILSLIDALGWRPTLVVLAGFHLLVCLPVHALLLRGEPKQALHEQALHGVTASAASTGDPALHPPFSTHLRSPVFWLIGVFTALGMAITAAVPAHLVPLLRERDLPAHWVMWVPASIGVVQVFGRFMIYRLDGRFNADRVNLGIVWLMPLSLLLLAAMMFSGPGAVVVLGVAFATVFGLANGMLTIVKGTAIAEYVSRAHVASLNGALGLPSAIARGLAPLAIGALWGLSNSYHWGVALLVLISLCSASAFWAAQVLARRQNDKSSK